MAAVAATMAAPLAAQPQAPRPAARPPVAGEEPPAGDAVDWRGLDRMDAQGRTIKRASATTSKEFELLVASAPYRVQVAVSDETSVRIIDAFTLERSRIFRGAKVHGFAFSSDGEILYVVAGAGPYLDVVAIDVTTAKSRKLGIVTLRPGEAVAHLEGGGGRDDHRVGVAVAKAAAGGGRGDCFAGASWRIVRLRQRAGAPPSVEEHAAPPAWEGGGRRAAVSPNTKLRAELQGTAGAVVVTGRFGDGSKRELATEKVANAAGLVWMRDSRGLLVTGRGAGACGPVEAVAWRAGAKAGWEAWRVPSDVEISARRLPGLDPQASPDGMRWVAMQAGAVVLVEPVPRFRGKIARIAAASAHFPAVRPGVRSLASGAGQLRHVELLLEQGDLDAADTRLQLDGAAAPVAERKRLAARLEKLRALRTRRAAELGLPPCALGSAGCGAAAAAAPPAAGDQAAPPSADAPGEVDPSAAGD